MPTKQELAELIRHACTKRGWGPTKLAREVSVAAGKPPDTLERQYARRWMSGEREPTYWLPYVVQALDLDLDASQEAESNGLEAEATDTVASVIQLGRRDVHRRNFLAATSGYALSALALPDLDSITRRTKMAPAGAVRVGAGEVAAVKQMVKALGDSAAELGGGHARHLAVRYLTDDVAPWLNGKYTEATGRELFAATSQLVHLAGWMAQDEGNDPEHQGRAQQYYAHAYRLAAEARDPELSATALRGLAVQAIDLGYRAEAVQLGEACVRYGKDLANPRAVAYYEATLANAAAQDDDRTTATRHLALSETAIGHSAATAGESWAAHYSPGRWAHESGMILTRLGDLDAAEEHLRLALDIHGLDRRRTRAIVLADLGGVRIRQGDLDGALATWNEFLACADGIRSVKVSTAAVDIVTRLNRFREMPEASQLQRKAVLFLT
ncbi:tetratricopeptide repeat protein [Streptomyces sp. NPDC021096]|uniref:tetratricopeptide repeat protein n=1 Tax=Streptomyces sp. NPDC021096 TaxID=3154792 RepID=UPI0033EC96BF